MNYSSKKTDIKTTTTTTTTFKGKTIQETTVTEDKSVERSFSCSCTVVLDQMSKWFGKLIAYFVT